MNFKSLTLRAVAFGFLSAAAAFAQPAITTGGTVNAADYSRSFAPGALVSIFGTNLATGVAQPSALPLPTALAGTSVEIVNNGTGTPIPIWYVSPSQINAQLPYSLPVGQAQIRVRVNGAVSAVDTIAISATAPRFFTQDFSGSGTVVATSTGYQLLTSANPAKPGSVIILWLNSMGQTSTPAVEGQAAPGTTPGSQPLTLGTAPTVAINGQPAPVLFAGLTPGSAGLYQLNVQVPFTELTGSVQVTLTQGSAAAQTNTTLPYRQLGFFSMLLGGKSVNGQTRNGAAGSNSALAFRHADSITWGNVGFNSWSNATGLNSVYNPAVGLAFTLKSGANIVYDNNGIETGSAGTFYNNAGGGADPSKPGLAAFYSMSNYFPNVYAGYVSLTQPTTISEIIGYFETNFNPNLPYDPANVFVKYRANIFSMANGLPKENGTFIGDVLGSDSYAGTFSYSDTGLRLVSSTAGNLQNTIYRLSFKLATPITLPAGEYWVSQDASIRAVAATSSTAQAVPADQAAAYTRPAAGQDGVKVNLFGKDLLWNKTENLPAGVMLRPTSTVSQ